MTDQRVAGGIRREDGPSVEEIDELEGLAWALAWGKLEQHAKAYADDRYARAGLEGWDVTPDCDHRGTYEAVILNQYDAVDVTLRDLQALATAFVSEDITVAFEAGYSGEVETTITIVLTPHTEAT